MKKILTLIVAIPIFLNAQIRFEEGTLEEAFSKAKSSNKMVFVYANTSWCEPCSDLELYTFSDLEVSNFFNESFVNVALDMEDYPGIDFARKYGVDIYPSLLFINSKGELKHRGCGSLDANDLMELGQIAMDGAESLSTYMDKYEKGDRSAEFIVNYLSLMELACMNVEGFVENYFDTLPDEDLLKEDNWIVFATYQWDIFSDKFQYVVKNKGKFEMTFGKAEVNAKIYDTYLAQYQEVFESEELHVFGMRSLISAVEAVEFDGIDTLSNMMNLHLSEVLGNWKAYGTHAIELVRMTSVDQPDELSELAWKFYLYIEDKSQLETALGWAKQAVDTNAEPASIDTYASLLYKLGKTKQAILFEKKALEMAQQLYADVTHYQYQLSKFESGS
ncbi:MAG: thioredoxin family protein [Ekhidna sp.]